MEETRVVEDRIVQQFLEVFAEDREKGLERTVESYLEMFPGFEKVLREEFNALVSELDPNDFGDERFGHFRLIRALGSGGQGVVYLAEDEKHHRQVALKVLPKSLTRRNSRVSTRMNRELEVLSRLDHPNICVVYEAGEIDGHPYLAMRFVPGESLDCYVSRVREQRILERVGQSKSPSSESKNSIKTAVTWMHKIALAVEAAHEARVVHRDIKPANILIHENGDPVVLDFGLARAEGSTAPSLTRSGDLIGTPQYMAPERLRGDDQQNPAGDVWSLGAMLFELLTGERPFDGPTMEAIIRKVEQDEPTDPRKLNGAISRDLSVVILTALEKPKGKRYQSAKAFADDLKRVLNQEPIAVRPVSWVGRQARWAKRHPARAGFFSTLTLSTIAAAIAAIVLFNLAKSKADALLESQDSLSRSAYEQARLLQFSNESGRSQQMIERLVESANARAMVLKSGGILNRAPSVSEIRSEGFNALLAPDVLPRHEYAYDSQCIGNLSSNGAYIALRSVTPTATRLDVNSIRVIDTASGEEVHRTENQELLDGEEGIAVSNDGRLIAVMGEDESSVVVWDMESDEWVMSLELYESMVILDRTEAVKRDWRISFSPDEKYLALVVAPRDDRGVAFSPHGFAIWRLDDGERLLGGVGGNQRYTWQSFSADSRYWIFPESTKVVRIYDLNEGKFVYRASLTLDVHIHRATVLSGEIPRVIAVTGGDNDTEHRLTQINMSNNKIEWVRPMGCRITQKYGPSLLLTKEEDAVVLVDSTYGIRMIGFDGSLRNHIQPAHSSSVDCLALTDEPMKIVSHARGDTTRVWEPKVASRIRSVFDLPNGGPLAGELAVSSSTTRAAYMSPIDGGSVFVWSPEEGASHGRILDEPTRSSRDPVLFEPRLIINATGSALVRLYDDEATYWDLERGTRHEVKAPQGSRFLRGTFYSGNICHIMQKTGLRYSLLSIPEEERFELSNLPDAIHVGAVSPCEFLVMKDERAEKGFELWNLDRGHLESYRPPVVSAQELVAPRASAQGNWIGVACHSGKWDYYVWKRGEETPRFSVPLEGGTAGHLYTFDPNERFLAVTGDQGEVKFLALETGELLLKWRAQDTWLRHLQFAEPFLLVTRERLGPMCFWNLDVAKQSLETFGLGW